MSNFKIGDTVYMAYRNVPNNQFELSNGDCTETKCVVFHIDPYNQRAIVSLDYKDWAKQDVMSYHPVWVKDMFHDQKSLREELQPLKFLKGDLIMAKTQWAPEFVECTGLKVAQKNLTVLMLDGKTKKVSRYDAILISHAMDAQK